MTDYDEPGRRKKTSIWVILLIAVGVVGGLLLLLVTLGVLFYATAEELPVTDAERGIVTTASYLAEWSEDLDPVLGIETVTNKRFLDGSMEVDYEYDHPDSDPDSTLYVSCTVTIENSASDARISYEAERTAASITLGLFGVKSVDRSDLFSWGQRSQSSLLLGEGGAVVGNHFACVTGKKSFQWIVIGIFWDEPGTLREVLEPVLTRVDRYDP
jgi:hypothetical protein